MKKKQISDETRAAILNAAWSLMAEKRKLDVGQAEIAAAAGVSRQTVFLAFGSRAGLLREMARNKDAQSDHIARLTAIASAKDFGRADFERLMDVWLDYLELIYPVGILLDAASLTDAEAASAWDDRMKATFLAGLKQTFRRLAALGELAGALPSDAAAELVWSLVHPTAWRLLVVECGWRPDDFRRSRHQIVREVILAKV